MYKQIQSRPTAFLWWPIPKNGITELSNGNFALQSVLVVLPITRAVTEDFPPNASYSLVACNVNQPLPINRAVTEDFPPQASYSLVSVVQLMPVNRAVTEDFPPQASYSLVSVVQLVPVNRAVSDMANCNYALQSVNVI